MVLLTGPAPPLLSPCMPAPIRHPHRQQPVLQVIRILLYARAPKVLKVSAQTLTTQKLRPQSINPTHPQPLAWHLPYHSFYQLIGEDQET